MAVYERAYRGYRGPLTASWSRFLVLPRYSFRHVFASRLFLAFFVACFIPVLVSTVIVYISHNLKLLEALGIRPGDVVAVNGVFFMALLSVQGLFFGFVLALVVGPGLICRDFANNALPLYMSRPFSRTEYVLGKLTVLAALLSAITWLPDLFLFGLKGYLSGWEWIAANLRIAVAIFIGSWIWILVLSLVALAVSALVKNRLLAGVLIFMVFTILGAFGGIVGEVFKIRWGHNFNISQMTAVVWARLFDAPLPSGMPSAWSAWLSLLIAGSVSILVLARRIKAYEVVR